MPSYFLYFRPLGVAGAYTVGIILDLHPKQHEDVYVRRVREVHCGSCGHQTPIPHTELAQGVAIPDNYIFYFIKDIIAGDEVEVTIKDDRLAPYQTIIYKPNKIEIIAKPQPCKLGMTVFRNINLNPIELVDTNKTVSPIPELQKLLLSSPREA